MATEDQMQSGRRSAGDGVPAKVVVCKKTTLTVAGNTTVKGSIAVPAGADLLTITLDTPIAITGTPTSSLFRAGITDGGQTIVAAVDAKAAGKIATTIVAALDQGAVAASAITIFYQLITSGGTSSAGPVTVLCTYAAPVF